MKNKARRGCPGAPHIRESTLAMVHETRVVCVAVHRVSFNWLSHLLTCVCVCACSSGKDVHESWIVFCCALRALWTYVHKIDKTGLKVVIEFPLFFLFRFCHSCTNLSCSLESARCTASHGCCICCVAAKLSLARSLGSCHLHQVNSIFKIHHTNELRHENTFSGRHFIQYLALSPELSCPFWIVNEYETHNEQHERERGAREVEREREREKILKIENCTRQTTGWVCEWAGVDSNGKKGRIKPNTQR